MVQFHTSNPDGFKNMYFKFKNILDLGYIPELEEVSSYTVEVIDGIETVAPWKRSLH